MPKSKPKPRKLRKAAARSLPILLEVWDKIRTQPLDARQYQQIATMLDDNIEVEFLTAGFKGPEVFDDEPNEPYTAFVPCSPKFFQQLEDEIRDSWNLAFRKPASCPRLSFPATTDSRTKRKFLDRTLARIVKYSRQLHGKLKERFGCNPPTFQIIFTRTETIQADDGKNRVPTIKLPPTAKALFGLLFDRAGQKAVEPLPPAKPATITYDDLQNLQQEHSRKRRMTSESQKSTLRHIVSDFNNCFRAEPYLKGNVLASVVTARNKFGRVTERAWELQTGIYYYEPKSDKNSPG